MKNIRRFTLVELLAVMALIAILSALGFGVYSYAKGKARESATEALLKQIEAGLESFHTKNGYYPRSAGGTFGAIKITLATDGTVESVDFGTETLTRETGTSLTKAQRMKNAKLESFTKAVDMQVLKNNLKETATANVYELTDAWGGTIYYRSPGEFKRGSFDLISAGADGKFGSGGNAEKPTGTDVTIFRENAGDRVCDDVFNF